MKTKIAIGIAALVVMFAVSTTAQETAKKTHQKVRTVTGCLHKDGDEYELRTKSGSTWELKSDTVEIAPHLGHTVTVTGAVEHAKLHGMKEDTKSEMKEHGMDKGATEHGHLKVTSLKMVSESCKQ
jgi:Protein of unknown function (DUF5818)